jgi:hypothetical protein
MEKSYSSNMYGDVAPAIFGLRVHVDRVGAGAMAINRLEHP